MLLSLIIVSLCLVISLSFNLYQYKKQKVPMKAQPTLDAEQLLHDLTRGPSLVRISVIDPSNLMIRSPK